MPRFELSYTHFKVHARTELVTGAEFVLLSTIMKTLGAELVETMENNWFRVKVPSMQEAKFVKSMKKEHFYGRKYREDGSTEFM